MISTGTGSSMRRACRALDVPRSTVCYRPTPNPAPAKRGPRTAILDERLVEEIRAVIVEGPFTGEGHRKVKARLGRKGIHVGKNRVLRLMGLHGLLAPTRRVHAHGDPAHEGTIIEAAPDRTWGTDLAVVYLTDGMRLGFFFTIDHCTDEILGWHLSERADRFAALESVRQAVLRTRGAISRDLARGVRLRHDHGSQFLARDFQREIRFFGITSSPAFVREPEGNGIAERFVRTLKEQVLWCRRFATIEEARDAIRAFIRAYNSSWLIGRNGYRSPLEVRAAYERAAA